MGSLFPEEPFVASLSNHEAGRAPPLLECRRAVHLGDEPVAVIAP